MFISWKRRRVKSTPFAFVRFSRFFYAQVAIKEMNGIEIRGLEMSVSMADYKRKDRSPKNYNGKQVQSINNHYSFKRRSIMETGKSFNNERGDF